MRRFLNGLLSRVYLSPSKPRWEIDRAAVTVTLYPTDVSTVATVVVSGLACIAGSVLALLPLAAAFDSSQKEYPVAAALTFLPVSGLLFLVTFLWGFPLSRVEVRKEGTRFSVRWYRAMFAGRFGKMVFLREYRASSRVEKLTNKGGVYGFGVRFDSFTLTYFPQENQAQALVDAINALR